MVDFIAQALQVDIYDLLPLWIVWVGVALSHWAAQYGEAWSQINGPYSGRTKEGLHKRSTARTTPRFLLLYVTGLPIALLVGIQLLGTLAFQLPLNAALGDGPFDEEPTWDLRGYDIPKPFYGDRRLYGGMLGLMIIALSLAAPYMG